VSGFRGLGALGPGAEIHGQTQDRRPASEDEHEQSDQWTPEGECPHGRGFYVFHAQPRTPNAETAAPEVPFEKTGWSRAGGD
jgi:hypothetical protein